MNEREVHVGTHPSGHPNKTAVNAENPIFGRPADPIPEVSIQQAAVVQSEKNPRETVQSPLINEAVASSVLPSAEDLDAVAAVTAVTEATGQKADDWTQTKGAGLTSDTSSAESGAEYTHSSGENSSKITGVDPVALPTQEEADAIVAKAQAEDEQRKAEADAPDYERFATGQKVRFTPDSGNDTTPTYTVEGWSREPGEGAPLFWKLDELPGGLFLEKNLVPAGLEEG